MNFLNNAVPNDEKQNDITEDTLASDDVIFIHNAIADERKQNDITEDTLASNDVIFIHNAFAIFMNNFYLNLGLHRSSDHEITHLVLMWSF